MKRAHRFAPGVIECPEPTPWLERVMRIVLVLLFLLALGVAGGQAYKHLILELWSL